MTRPGAAEVGDYRNDVDRRIVATLARPDLDPDVLDLLVLGLHHEQQHQELLLMDVKHLLSLHPSGEGYRPQDVPESTPAVPLRWIEFDGGLVDIGHPSEGFAFDNHTSESFAFDNESPRHRHFLEPFAIADRLVTVAEWRDFIDDGGYRRPDLWLSDGWNTVQTNDWNRPIYWLDDNATAHTLGGVRRLHDAEPVSHISLYEADAYARWAGARLPIEFEWEHAIAAGGNTAAGTGDARKNGAVGDSLGRPFDLARLEPWPADSSETGLRQAFGACWQWTASAYLPYPGFAAPEGAVGEYNAKFMSGQIVLRGSSSLTPPGHARSTYRNFFPPSARWPMTGLRLARGVRS